MSDIAEFRIESQEFIQKYGVAAFVGLLISVILGYVLWAALNRFLQSIFDKKIESFKNYHDESIKKLEYRINRQLDRTVHFHKNEYEILPESWSKLKDAYTHANDAVFGFIASPDLDKLDDTALDGILAKSGLSESDTQTIKNSNNKNKEYSKIIRWKKLVEAKNKCQDARLYFDRISIFMPENIEILFYECLNYAADACEEEKMNIQWGDYSMRLERDKSKLAFNFEGKTKIKELQNSLRERLSKENIS